MDINRLRKLRDEIDKLIDEEMDKSIEPVYPVYIPSSTYPNSGLAYNRIFTCGTQTNEYKPRKRLNVNGEND